MKYYADLETFISEGPVDTFGCACRVDEGNTLVDNSKAGELVENNSQWHPGFSTLGSVPGNLSIGMVPPIPHGVAQGTAVADPDFLDHDEGETEDEADEDMDELDVVNDDSDEAALAAEEAALAAEEAAQLAAFALESSANGPIPQAYTADAISYLSEVEHILSNDSFISDAEDSDIADFEEMLSEGSASQTDQQMLEGNA